MKTMTIAAVIAAVAAGAAMGQTPAPAPASQPAAEVRATILETTGIVKYRQTEGGKWQDAKKGDVLKPPAEIRTGPRSAVTIKLHTTAILEVRAYTRVAIAELALLGDTEKTSLFLRRGTVRAGIIEEKTRSDFQIACPAAVLTREGTWGMEMSYDPATGRYNIALDNDGLVRVMDLVTGRRVGLQPGQYVTQALQMWVRTAMLERMVSLTDPFGVTSVETAFYAENSGGLTAASPTGNLGLTQALGLMTSDLPQMFLNQQARAAALNWLPEFFVDRLTPPTDVPTVRYRYGNFGTHVPQNVTQRSVIQRFGGAIKRDVR